MFQRLLISESSWFGFRSLFRFNSVTFFFCGFLVFTFQTGRYCQIKIWTDSWCGGLSKFQYWRFPGGTEETHKYLWIADNQDDIRNENISNENQTRYHCAKPDPISNSLIEQYRCVCDWAVWVHQCWPLDPYGWCDPPPASSSSDPGSWSQIGYLSECLNQVFGCNSRGLAVINTTPVMNCSWPACFPYQPLPWCRL